MQQNGTPRRRLPGNLWLRMALVAAVVLVVAAGRTGGEHRAVAQPVFTPTPTNAPVSPAATPTNTPVPNTEPTATPTQPGVIVTFPTSTPTPAPTVTQPGGQPTGPTGPIGQPNPPRVPDIDVTVSPTAIPTSVPTTIPTTVPTSVPTSTPTTAPTSAPTSTPTTAPTARPTTAPTAVPTSVPTTVTPPTTVPPTTVPQPANPQGMRLTSATFISGANPLVPGQTTRIQAVYTLTNNTNTVVDYSNTNECDLGAGVVPVSAMTAIGTTGARGNTLLWGGFTLAPGQSEQITLVLDVTPIGADAGRAAPIIPEVRTTGVVLNGGFFLSPGDSLVSTSVGGLLNGGLVQAAPPPPRTDTPAAGGAAGGAVAAPTGGVTTSAPAPVVAAAPRPATPGQPTTSALPRSGTGMQQAEESTSTAWMLASVAVAMAVTGALVLRRKRAG